MNLSIEKLIEPKRGLPDARKKFHNQDLFALIVPILIEQFLALLVGLADTLMISYAGEAAVSGVSLVNQLNNIFIMIFTALASGGSIIASQYIGNRDQKRGNLAAGQLVMMTTVVSVLITGIVLLFGKTIFLTLFGKVDAAVYEAGMLYLKISALSFPFLALYNGCAGLYRSMGKTKTIMNVSLVMNLFNVVGNYIGIFIFHAGVLGVAYPTLFSRVFAAIVMVKLSFSHQNQIFITTNNIFRIDFSMIKRIFRIAIPNSIESGLFQISKVALSSIVAMFGTLQIAANGIAQSFWSMSALFALAMGPAFVTVIGQYMGAADLEGADYYMKKLLRITIIGNVLWNIVAFCLTPFILQFYSLSDEGIRLVLILVLIHNVFNGFVCPISFSLSNGLRAAGDIKYTMYSAIFSTCVCRVAFSIILGLWMNLGVIGIALAMALDWIIKGLFTYVRYKNKKWQSFQII